MSTGIQSTQTALRPAFAAAQSAQNTAKDASTPPQPTAQPQPSILRTGEIVSTSLQSLEDANSKTFHCTVKGAKFPMPDGLVIQFLGGVYTTNVESEIYELQKVADKAGSLIYTKKEAVIADEQLAKLGAEAAADSEGSGPAPTTPM